MKHASEAVRKVLLRCILDGGYRPEEVLPTIPAMAKMFNVSLGTMQTAIHTLKKDGVIEARPREGIFVKAPRTAMRRGGRVGLVCTVPDEILKRSPFSAEVVAALRKALAPAGLKLVACPLPAFTFDLVARLRKQKLAGLILLDVGSDRLISELRELCLPMVSMDFDVSHLGISSVSFDNVAGAFDATRHLIRAGHRRIAFLRYLKLPPLRTRILYGYNVQVDPVIAERMLGYRLAMHGAGLVPVFMETRPETLKQILLDLFVRRPPVTAIVCIATPLLGPIVNEARELGFRIPEDFSLIGYGNARTACGPNKVISYIWNDYKGLGEETARLFLEARSGPPPQRKLLPSKLMLHDSVAAAPPESTGKPVLAAAGAQAARAPGKVLQADIQE